MNNHVTDWLGAYHDGELSGLRLREVEAHLVDCETCQAELKRLQALTMLLQESPAAEAITPPERFVSQVGLRLPRRPEQPASRRALELGWRLVPAGLLAAGAFVQAAFILAGVVQGALRLGLGGEVATRLLPSGQGGVWLGELFTLSDASLSDIAFMILELPSRGGPLGWTTTLHVISLVVIGVLFCSWLASWWVRYGRRQPGFHNNTV